MVPVDDLRDRRLVRFDKDVVKTITVKKGETTLSFARRRDEAQKRDIWTMTAPHEREVKDSVLSGLLYRLWSLKARRYVREGATPADLEGAGLSTPEVQVELGKDGSADLGVFLFAAEKDHKRLATGAGSGQIAEIDPDVVNEISSSPDDYKAEAVEAKE